MVDITKTRAYRYALECADEGNEKVGKYVRKQCVLWLEIADGKNPGAYINMKQYKLVTDILKIMMHPDLGCSMFKGLEDYAMLFVVAVLCTYKKGGGRLYTTGDLEISRKNFKTFVSAVIFIILMVTERRFSRLFSVAPDFKLSNELRLAVRKIIKVSPLLEKHFKINRDMITCLITDVEYMPLAYSNDRMDGKLAAAFLADEAGAMDSYPVEAMRSSQITLKNKLGIIISTQYPNENNVMIDEIDLAKKVLDGIIDRNNIFALLYEPDDEIVNQWEYNDNVLYQSNPVALNNPEMMEDLRDKRQMAVLYENKRENFLCKHCNIRYKGLGTEGYVPVDKVQQCRIERNDEWWKGRRVYLGCDLSRTTDNTAVAMVTYDYESSCAVARVMGFIPSDNVERKTIDEKFDYRRSTREDECRTCGESVIDYSEVERYIQTLPEMLGVEIVAAGFDPYNAVSTVQKLESGDEPIECVMVKQHSSILHPATKKLKEDILNKAFRYERNMLLENSFENARCTEDTNLNMYVNKKRSAGKVDMVVALINAYYILNEYELLGDSFVCISI